MIQKEVETDVPHEWDQLSRVVTRAQRRVWLTTAVAGASRALGAVTLCLLAAGLVEWLVGPRLWLSQMDRPLRWALLALLCAAAVGSAWRWLAWPLMRRASRQRIIGRIDQAVPALEDRLTTALTFGRDGSGAELAGIPRVFARRITEEAAAGVAQFHPGQIAPWRGPVRQVAACLCCLAVLLLAVALIPGYSQALARLATPHHTAAPAWLSDITVTPGSTTVTQGQPVTVGVYRPAAMPSHLSLALQTRSDAPDAAWQPQPLSVDERNRDSDAAIDAATANDPVNAARLAWVSPALNQPLHYRVMLGPRTITSHTLAIAPLPQLALQEVRITPPAYTGVTEPRVVSSADAQRISALVGSSIQLTYAAVGPVAAGELVPVRRESVTETKDVTESLVWVDDALPPDAEPEDWSWTRVDPYSGGRSFITRADGKRAGFATTLHPLVLMPGDTLALHIRHDAAMGDLPALSFALRTASGNWAAINVGRVNTDFGYRLQAIREIRIGLTMPEAGDWQRINIPAEKLRQIKGDKARPTDPIEVYGFRAFSLRSPVAIDRIERLRTAPQTQTITRTVRGQPVSLAANTSATANATNSAGQLTARLTLDESLTLRPEAEHAATGQRYPQPTLTLAAIADQPPVAQVQRPGRDVVIDQPQTLPVELRFTDDVGLKSATLWLGRSAEALNQSVPLAQWDQPGTTDISMPFAIDTQLLDLRPGASVYYRVQAADRKGQLGLSPVYRVTQRAADPGAADAADSAAIEPSIDLTGLADAARVLEQVLRDHEQAMADTQAQSTQPDATPADALAANPELAAAAERLQSAQLEANWQANQTADALNQASRDAARSASSTRGEARALGRLAEQARRLAESLPAPAANREAALQAARDGDTDKARDQADQAGEIARALDDLADARDALTTDPDDAVARADAVVAEQDARSYVRDRETHTGGLAEQQKRLQELADQTARQRQDTQTADAADLPARQQDFDQTRRAAQQALDDAAAAARRSNPSASTPWANPEQSEPRDPANNPANPGNPNTPDSDATADSPATADADAAGGDAATDATRSPPAGNNSDSDDKGNSEDKGNSGENASPEASGDAARDELTGEQQALEGRLTRAADALAEQQALAEAQGDHVADALSKAEGADMNTDNAAASEPGNAPNSDSAAEAGDTAGSDPSGSDPAGADPTGAAPSGAAPGGSDPASPADANAPGDANAPSSPPDASGQSPAQKAAALRSAVAQAQAMAAATPTATAPQGSAPNAPSSSDAPAASDASSNSSADQASEPSDSNSPASPSAANSNSQGMNDAGSVSAGTGTGASPSISGGDPSQPNPNSPGSTGIATTTGTAPPDPNAGATGQGTANPGDPGLWDGPRAGMHRLPPRARDALIEGLREPTPQGYDEAVRAYYQSLNRDQP